MITERQQEQASLYALDTLSPVEQAAFAAELAGNPELLALARDLQSAVIALVASARDLSTAALPFGLKGKVLRRIEELEAAKLPRQGSTCPATRPQLCPCRQ